MDSTYLTEQQQIEQLKAWWKSHGLSAVSVFVVILLFGIGWHYWRQHREAKLERASAHYEMLLDAVVNEDNATAAKEANLLKNNYKHTPYTALAGLMLARNDIYKNNYADASMELQWVMRHANAHILKQVARLRLARIYLQQGQPQQSLQLLQKVDDSSYSAMTDELKGDSELALNHAELAKQWYQRALAQLPNYDRLRPILVMKLNDLPQSGAVMQTPGA